MIFYIFPDIFLCFWLLVMGLLIFVMWDRRTSDDAGQLMIFATAQGLVIELFFLYHTLYRDFNAVFYSNNLFFYSKIFIVFIALLCIIIISVFFRSRHVLYFEFAILFLISVQGMLWMLSANDLFSIYLFFELQAFCFYILVGMHHSTRSAEASLRYFIYGSFSSAIFLLGISFIYGFFGTCEFSKLLLLCDYDVIDLRSSGLLIFGLLCIFVGLFFKLGIVPFHIWVADVYDGAPLFITAILAIMPKFPLVVVFLKIVYVFYGALILLNFSILFNILAIASIFFGTIFALYENKIKRLMAFSAISHMGYVLLALNLYIVDGFIVIVFYMIVYVFLSIYFFSLLIAFWQSSCGRSIDFLSDFLTVRNPFLIANFVVAFLSMAGVPPFAGFFAKWYLFISLWNSGNIYIAFFVLLMNIVSSVYYIRLVRFLFFHKQKELIWPTNEMNGWLSVIISLLFCFNVFFIIIQSIMILFISIAVLTTFFSL